MASRHYKHAFFRKTNVKDGIFFKGYERETLINNFQGESELPTQTFEEYVVKDPQGHTRKYF